MSIILQLTDQIIDTLYILRENKNIFTEKHDNRCDKIEYIQTSLYQTLYLLVYWTKGVVTYLSEDQSYSMVQRRRSSTNNLAYESTMIRQPFFNPRADDIR